MNIYEFAMKMEEDGRAYYLEHADKTDNKLLKRILTELAEDELKHYKIFKALRDKEQTEYKDSEKTTIINSVKNVFETLREENQEYSFNKDYMKVWIQAMEVEKKSEDFYREKAGEVDNENEKNIFNKIADEEHRHWVTMENVIQFLEKPQKWLEDAEWNNLEVY